MKSVLQAGKWLSAVLGIVMLTECSSPKSDKKEETTISYKAGDRKGINKDSITDISTSENMAQLLAQRWDNKDDDESIRASGYGSKLELPLRGFYLYENSYAVKDPRDHMEIGTWNLDEKNKLIYMTFKGSTTIYKIMAISFDELVLKKQEEGAKNVYYKADGLVNKNKADDPFYADNMRWREPARSSETDAELLKRLKGCLHFYYLLYTDNHHRNSADISFYGLPGCLKWYAGGIHLQKKEDLEKSWKAIFYNAKDADRAYEFMDRLISKKYKWGDKDENWLVLNAGVLRQMEKMTDSL